MRPLTRPTVCLETLVEHHNVLRLTVLVVENLHFASHQVMKVDFKFGHLSVREIHIPDEDALPVLGGNLRCEVDAAAGDGTALFRDKVTASITNDFHGYFLLGIIVMLFPKYCPRHW